MRPWTTTLTHHPSRRVTAVLALLVAASSAVSACGAGDPETTSESATSSISPTPSPSSPSSVSPPSSPGATSGAVTATGSPTAGAGSRTEGATTAAGTPGRTTPPPGSGATAPGITPTTPAPLQPSGSTRTAVACRQLYPTITVPITAFNAANSADDAAAVTRAAADMAKAADAVPGAVKDSGDEKLISLSTVVVDKLKAVVTAVGANADVDGGELNAATAALWAHCQSAR